mmetsp:Transcript_118883/g.380940  ORF Transcript_118883/g.380940 Transcript_118883/m.380940 type:complete len:335 (+) Transcript_118883:536-1540(+)
MLALLLHAQLVLLKHTLADYTCQESDHAEGTKDGEDDEEGTEPRELVEHRPKMGQVRLRHHLEKGEHSCGDGVEVGVGQSLHRLRLVLAPAEGPHQDHGANVEGEQHEDGDPKHCLASFDEAIGEQVQLLQEAHDLKNPQDPQQTDQPKGGRATASLEIRKRCAKKVHDAHRDDGEIEDVPIKVAVRHIKDAANPEHGQAQRQLPCEDHQKHGLDGVPDSQVRHIRLETDHHAVGQDAESDEALKDHAVQHDFDGPSPPFDVILLPPFTQPFATLPWPFILRGIHRCRLVDGGDGLVGAPAVVAQKRQLLRKASPHAQPSVLRVRVITKTERAS